MALKAFLNRLNERAAASIGTCLRWLVLCASFVLSACTSQPLVGRYVAVSPGCCATFADYSFRPLVLGSEIEFTLSSTTPTLPIGGTVRHAAGFMVPQGITPSSVIVSTALSTDYLPKATAVTPDLFFYDGAFRPLGNVTVADMQDTKAFWRTSVSGRAAVPAQARYIVVVVSSGRSGTPLIRSANGRPYRLPPAALGDLSIRLFGETSTF